MAALSPNFTEFLVVSVGINHQTQQISSSCNIVDTDRVNELTAAHTNGSCFIIHVFHKGIQALLVGIGNLFSLYGFFQIYIGFVQGGQLRSRGSCGENGQIHHHRIIHIAIQVSRVDTANKDPAFRFCRNDARCCNKSIGCLSNPNSRAVEANAQFAGSIPGTVDLGSNEVIADGQRIHGLDLLGRGTKSRQTVRTCIAGICGNGIGSRILQERAEGLIVKPIDISLIISDKNITVG